MKLALKAQQENKAHRATPGHKDRRDRPDPSETLDRREHRDSKATPEHKDRQDRPAPSATLGRREHKDSKATRALKVRLVQRE